MTRQETFAFFQDKGFDSVPNGIVAEFAPKFIQKLRALLPIEDTPDIKVTDNINEAVESIDVLARQAQRRVFERLCRLVVYTDPEKRQGEGMQLMNAYDAMQQYPQHYCSQYCGITIDDSGFSYRLLTVGNSTFVLEFSSSDWRSRCGEFQSAVTNRVHGERNLYIPYPVYAIDFIGNPVRAVDLDLNPSLAPISNYMTQEQIDKEIESFLEMMRNETHATTTVQ